ncbi:MAG: trypsin-like peptidase domain-containing protein [Pirellulales bacterium]
MFKLGSRRRVERRSNLGQVGCIAAAVVFLFGLQLQTAHAQNADSTPESASKANEDSTAARPAAGAPPAPKAAATESVSKMQAASDDKPIGARQLSSAFRQAAAKTLPSVVTIWARTRQGGSNGVADIVGGAQNFDSVGSGVIVSNDGLVLTNHHVIDKAVHIEVRLSDGRQYEARDPRSDPRSDIAIVRIDAGEDLPAAEIGDPNELQVGDWVLAIGSPFRLEATVSAGIISAKHGKVDDLVAGRILQTDAAINPGNSGGPLIDLDGKVVGINTAISSTTGSFQGIGFAIPIKRAVWVKSELLTHKRVRRGVLGVSTQDLPIDVAKQLHLPPQGGAYVTRTTPGRPAEKAGLAAGDIILSLDGQPIQSGADLASVVEESPVDHPIELVVLRSGEKKTLTVSLDARE